MLKFIAAFRIDFTTLFKALQKILAYNMTANIDNPIHQKKKKKKRYQKILCHCKIVFDRLATIEQC